MPYSADHKARTHSRILTSARRLFNRRGFSDVSIDEIMAGAGLTRGGFYAHFDNKEQLYAEAIGHIFADHPAENWDDYDLTGEGAALAREVVRSYLSDEHFEEIERSCPLIALPSDTARSGDGVRKAYRQVFDAMVGVFESSLDDRPGVPADRALAIAALCVGGMVLSRAIDDRALGDRIRAACCEAALRAGGWGHNTPADRPGDGQRSSTATPRPELPRADLDA